MFATHPPEDPWVILRKMPDPLRPGEVATEIVPWPFKTKEEAEEVGATLESEQKGTGWYASRLTDTPWGRDPETLEAVRTQLNALSWTSGQKVTDLLRARTDEAV